MPIRTGFSTRELGEAVEDLKVQCGEPRPKIVFCFASSRYEPGTLSLRMQEAFPDSQVIGCSTAGEIVSGRMLCDSAVAMALGSDIVEGVATCVIEDLTSRPDIAPALRCLEDQFHAPLSALDFGSCAGVVLIDGLSGAEEWLMEKLGDKSDLVFVGGSAGDDLKFKRTHLWANGKSYTNAALLAILKLRNGFSVIKTQSFRPTEKTLIATRVDETHRQVLEFNHRPALAAYCDALGVPPDHAERHFMRFPLGLMVEGEPFVRSPQRVQDESIIFYCQIREGAQLRILEAADIVAGTRSAVQAQNELRPIAGLIDFDCILRTLELRAEQRCSEYGAIFEKIPTVGFSTYGEEYLGHINQTSTMLALSGTS